jgi:hypothetical protein
MFFIIDIGNESRGNVDTNLLFYTSDGKYWTRGGNGVNSSADKWISTIDMFVKPLINKKRNSRQILQVCDMIKSPTS